MPTPVEYRLELSDEMNNCALGLINVFETMPLNELKKLKRYLERAPKQTANPDAVAVTRSLACVGLSYVTALKKAQRARARDAAAAQDESREFYHNVYDDGRA